MEHRCELQELLLAESEIFCERRVEGGFKRSMNGVDLVDGGVEESHCNEPEKTARGI